MNREFIHAELSTHVDGPTQVALARVAEECGELAIEAMKSLRFGLQNRYPANGPTNAQKLVAEYRDIEHALIDAGVLGIDDASWATRVRQRYLAKRRVTELNKRRIQDWTPKDLQLLDEPLEQEADELLR